MPPSSHLPIPPLEHGPAPSALLDPARRIHFLGIGGISMSALAELLHQRGYRVSGSDAADGENLRRLADLGIDVRVGHDPGELAQADAVIYTSAVRESHPVRQEARRRGLPLYHRAELLGALTDGGRLLAVTGTHGKTTVSACLGHLLERCGWDPTVLVGGEVAQWPRRNLRIGQSSWWVAEADESDGSFVHMNPEAVLLTNVEADHLDFHRNEANLLSAFESFLGRLPAAGHLVYCLDDPRAAQLAKVFGGNAVGYGVHPDAAVRVLVREMRPGAMEMEMRDRAGMQQVVSPLGGRHNAVNLAGVYALGRVLGLAGEQIAAGLEDFRGVRRRQEYLGQAGGYRIFDDYAHHPTEIRATLQMFRELYPGPLTAVFQPHLYSRTERFAAQFAEALRGADRVIVTEVYGAREEPRADITGEMIIERIGDHPAARFVPDWREVPLALAGTSGVGGILLTLGAGDITGLGPLLLRKWAQGRE